MLNFIKKSQAFILEEKDVTTVLDLVNHTKHTSRVYAGNCGWGGGQESKWFIMFHATEKGYGKIVREMSEIGKFDLDVRPGGQVDITFERV